MFNVLIVPCSHATIISYTCDSHVWQDLLPLLPGAIAGEIESKAANLNNLVVEAYKVCMYRPYSVLQVNFYYHFCDKVQSNTAASCKEWQKECLSGNLELGLSLNGPQTSNGVWCLEEPVLSLGLTCPKDRWTKNGPAI